MIERVDRYTLPSRFWRRHWFVRIREGGKEINTFVSSYVTFNLEVSAFGLMNKLSNFQRMNLYFLTPCRDTTRI